MVDGTQPVQETEAEASSHRKCSSAYLIALQWQIKNFSYLLSTSSSPFVIASIVLSEVFRSSYFNRASMTWNWVVTHTGPTIRSRLMYRGWGRIALHFNWLLDDSIWGIPISSITVIDMIFSEEPGSLMHISTPWHLQKLSHKAACCHISCLSRRKPRHCLRTSFLLWPISEEAWASPWIN